MLNFPKLETNQLILSRILYTDIPVIVEYAGNVKIAEMTLNIPHPYQEEDAIFWINMANNGFKDKTQFTFGIRLKSTDEFIGGIGLKINNRFDRAELAYWVAEPFWNNGYASEAVSGILKFGFETLELNKIYATHIAENPASGRVMIKNKMILEGELKDHTKKEGQYKSIFQYRLTRNEYKKATGSNNV